MQPGTPGILPTALTLHMLLAETLRRYKADYNLFIKLAFTGNSSA